MEQSVEKTTRRNCMIFCSREQGASQFSRQQKIIQILQVVFSTDRSKDTSFLSGFYLIFISFLSYFYLIFIWFLFVQNPDKKYTLKKYKTI